MQKKIVYAFLIFMLPVIGIAEANPALSITPEKFDFGWCPENAKITAEFSVKNTSQELIPLTQVLPACGCTAADFTPMDLATDKESKIKLTFNTRGYGKVSFEKTAQVAAGNPEKEYTVTFIGTVSDPNAKVAPIGDGIVAFDKASNDNKKSIEINNTLDQDVSIKTIQAPADWITLDWSSEKIAAGKKATLTVKAKGALDEDRNTSATFEVTQSTYTSRFTVAFLTGEAPEAMRKIRTAAPPKKTVAPVKVAKPKVKQELK